MCANVQGSLRVQHGGVPTRWPAEWLTARFTPGVAEAVRVMRSVRRALVPPRMRYVPPNHMSRVSEAVCVSELLKILVAVAWEPRAPR